MDQPEKVAKVRTYDCTYCKRGFTKAQALGGHMNIHSKRKAGKAKTVASHHDQYSSSLTHKAKNDSEYYNNMANNCNYSTVPISSDNCFGPRRSNYPMHLPTPDYPSFSLRDSACSSPHGSYAGENFSLGIGPIIVVDGDDHQERNEVVDVELRLGFNP
ncbi:hypothetical protein RHGRI_012094 [Rhododendron griersonianum]|uniref:C2H2-type domain-containing protein n=1 Tax=Rhododendron griersonianum TaxID=479676 RepID=A0AAV6KQB0_9ERIC|nr:hypothetical protein RHGRI_012094 [Rhododendron griersonianum]